jgi:hypothetical protein
VVLGTFHQRHSIDGKLVVVGMLGIMSRLHVEPLHVSRSRLCILSLGHQAVYANEMASFQNQSRELKIKKDGGPFVLLSEKTQDEFCAQTGEESL